MTNSPAMGQRSTLVRTRTIEAGRGWRSPWRYAFSGLRRRLQMKRPQGSPANTRGRRPSAEILGMSATMEHHIHEDRLLLRPLGGWVIDEARRLDGKLRELFGGFSDGRPRELVIDLSDMSALDTAGAFLLARTEREILDKGGLVEWVGADRVPVALLERVRYAMAEEGKSYRSP